MPRDEQVLKVIGEFLSQYHLGDIASVLGLLVALVGFAVTVANVLKAKAAAKQAETAASEMKKALNRFDTVTDFGAAISILEEIRRLHRERAWAVMPDRYSALRKHLISIRGANPDLSREHQIVIQGAIQALVSIEATVERSIAKDNGEPDVARLNRLMSKHVDGLHEVLVDLRQRIAR